MAARCLLSQSGGADLLDVWDDSETNPVLLKSRAHELEAAALSVPGVIQAEGANASWSTSAFCYATSHGFRDGWRASRHGLSVSAIAEQGGAMERDYDYESTRYLSSLPDPSEIGRQAGQRAVARLEQLIEEIGEGFLISEMFGPSLNSNTGDYSVGVSGFKIEKGARAFPVSEVTIAGNLRNMYKTMIPASDLKMDSATNAPSLLCEGLTLAGS